MIYSLSNISLGMDTQQQQQDAAARPVLPVRQL